MKKIYFLLIALIMSNASFADGWVETFNGDIRVVALDDETVTPPDDAWYISGITVTNPFGMKSIQTAWKTASSWNFGASLKPAAASFVSFNGNFALAGSNSSEFSLFSPQFTPEAGISTLYYEIQEIKTFPESDPNSGEQIYFEVATKNTEGAWVWASSSANILAGLTGYNSATTPVTVLQADLSSFIGQDIKIRFRGVTDKGAFAAVITKVALIDNSVLNLAVSTLKNIPVLIPEKHISQVVSATVVNQSKATSAGEASIKATSTPAEYEATAAVPALATFQSENITFGTPFAPQLFGEYKINYELITTPAIPDNSVTSTPFTVTPGTFASDKGSLSGTASNGLPIGKKFSLPVADEIESVSVAWAKSSMEPDSYDFKIIIYKVTGETAESVFESATLTRPTFAQTPPNGRSATFTDYIFPTPVSLVPGDYIFALKQTKNLYTGVDYTYESPSYIIDTLTHTISIDPYNNLLIRVNTGSNILLSPSSGYHAANVNAPVLVTFRDANGISGINPAGISIVDGEGTAVTGIGATYDAGVITINHAALQYNTQYTVSIPASAVTGYDKAISWSFTTAGTIQPKTYLPGQWANNVAINAPVSVQFDRTIPSGSSLAGITIVVNNDAQEAVTGVSATIEDFTLKIAHADFSIGTEYKVSIPAEAINEYEGEAISWTFTTVPPLDILSFYPEHNATDVSLNTPIRVVFNQNIPAGSSLAGITVNETPVSASISGAQLNINTSELTLQEGTEYEVIIPAGSVAGYDQEIKWSFSSFTALAIVAYSPEENATNVGISAEVSVQFNKNIFRPQFGPAPPPITIKAGETEVAGISASTNGNKLIIAHADLEYNTEYTVTIPVRNINNWEEEITWKFTTESDELNVIGYTPESGAVNVSVRNQVAVSFNKAITLGNTAGVTINGTAPSSVALGSSIDGINNQIRLNHAVFEQGVEYTVVVPAGSVTGYDREITWKFTTVEPLVPVVSPADGAVSVGINEPLTITFNRAPLRPIRPAGSITIEGENGIAIDVTSRSWNAEGDVITIEHTPFDNNILYTVTIPAGFIIDAGDYSQTITWSFTTGGTGIKDVTDPVKVYPAITKGKLTINSEPGTKVKIVNLAGQTISVHQLSGNTLNLNLAFNSGVYLVILENNDRVSTHKIILQR